MKLQCHLFVLAALYFSARASFPDSYDKRLQQLPSKLSQLLPAGLPPWLVTFYSPVQAISGQCLRDAATYQSGLKSFQPWALQMLDSSSKLPSGLMLGHLHDLGNFDQCLATADAPFPLQFCLVDIHNFSAPLSLVHTQVETTLGGLPLLIKDPKLSFCLPASCMDTDVEIHFTRVLSPWNISARVKQYSCSKLESVPLDTLDWMAILVSCTIFLLLTFSTAYELWYPSKAEDDASCCLLLSFSMVSNCRRLLSTSDPRRSFAYLGGLRFLSMVWVILGHHTLLNFLVPSINWIVPYMEMPRPIFSPLQNAMLAVDTFLVITGTLIAYFFLEEIGTRRRSFKLLPFYFHRIIRVTPALALVVLLAATLSSRIGRGPLWQTFYLRHQEDCRAHGWTNLLYLNNYIYTDNQCVSFTWYLCVDMHLYFFSPLVLFPLLHYRNFSRIGLPLLIIAAVSVNFLVAFYNKLPAGSLITRDLRTADNYRLEYTTTHTRAAPWLVGIGLGYMLHRLKDFKFKMSQVMVVTGWVCAGVLASVSVVGVSYFHQDYQMLHYNPLQSALYISLHRVCWAVAVAWLIFACETDNAGLLRSFLASRLFQPLGRLAFSLYMVHGGIQYAMVASQQAPQYFSSLYMARDVLGELMLSIGQAVLLSLSVEAPFIRLEKAFFQKAVAKDSFSLNNKETKRTRCMIEDKA
ncbi:nose resistant to fluoxetine protein 6-like [Macrosteles quadrilineatus]|uniref:nose resistant to fluoxetine protein 6-like n=1 Tax=Macrosteles quadrilineatus TaxID=74068 RepID=UPI0023E30844|nr:nose resistant to fluoxetine protein 6-like [Macrosteles quadrilineatus]